MRHRSWFERGVAFYGLFHAGHVLLNATYIAGDGPPPFPGPPGGWDVEAVAFLDGFAVVDLAVASILIVVAYFARRRWATSALVVVLTASVYASLAFTYGVVVAGGWRPATTGPYVATWIPFLPVIAIAAPHRLTVSTSPAPR